MSTSSRVASGALGAVAAVVLLLAASPVSQGAPLPTGDTTLFNGSHGGQSGPNGPGGGGAADGSGNGSPGKSGPGNS